MAAMVHNKARDLATYSQPYGQGAGTTGKQTNVSGDLRFYEPEVQSTYPMVQNKARDSAPYSRPYWQGERTTAEQADPPDELRYHEPEVRSTYPITIGELLRRHCHVKAKKYFVAVINDEGKMEYYAGPNQIAHPERLFNVEGFLRSQARDGSVTSSSQGDENPFEKDKHRLGQIEYWGSHRPLQDRRHNQGYEDYNSPYRTTKKPRKTVPRRNSDEPGQTMVQTSKKGLRIGDLGALWSFYDQRFKDCQQTACRLIAKAWVKALEPRKQSTHPYIGSVAPDWWPKSWGTGPDNKVRHKEPDHLYKKERIHLLIHILRLVVEPNNNQHSAIRYLNLNIGKLEEVTMECLNSFFADKENPKNSQKKLYLKEIFKVAKFEERYKNGEIG
ncbi:hypothetical protein GQ53DRAFT_853325 [Thozetella sp. PMI_491]|nr:hypothetical protein GQ53DRAFT_853325 [Thozetella sp. PMI_491]